MVNIKYPRCKLIVNKKVSIFDFYACCVAKYDLCGDPVRLTVTCSQQLNRCNFSKIHYQS